MKITTTNQKVYVTPRFNLVCYQVDIVNEQTKEVITKAVNATQMGNFIELDLNFTALEDNFYTITLSKSGFIFFKGKIYCTNQDSDKFQIAKNDYLSYGNETQEEYIIRN